MIKKFTFLYIIVDAILILISLVKGGFWLINTQVAFISSMLIVFSSFYGYKKAIHAKSSLFKKEDFDEEIDDKEIIKKTRKLTKASFLALTPFRIFSYIFLILAFLFLNRHNLLEITPFLLGLSIIPIGSITAGFFGKKI